jgi:hypothetical protein
MLIVSNPDLMMGKPAIAGTRVTVESILERLAAGEAQEQTVLDLLEVEVDFTIRCFAEGDDPDFIFGLRVDDRHWNAD